MAFMSKKKRYKFLVECTLEELTEVPFVSAVLFAKLRLLDGGNFQKHSTREEVRNHCVVWNAPFSFVCKMSANATTGVLEPALLRISVRKECKGGRSFVKLGFCDVNLAEVAGSGGAARRCLLEGYGSGRRQDNSVLLLRLTLTMIAGDPLFKVPERKPDAVGAEDSEQEAAADEDAVSSTPSSGFGSLTKRPHEAGGGGGGGGMAAVAEWCSGQDQLHDLVDQLGPSSARTVPAHSRNSSSTSAECSSKASGYGSSASGQSAHSRQSSEGDATHHRGRVSRPEPDAAILECPEQDATLYYTPDCTASPSLLSPERSFAMPSYFDKKRQPSSSTPARVPPLANFQIFKQKSLNTIPALADRSKKHEELFNNFPFLTPIAHRKNSLISAASRLSCLEDEFYWIPSDAEDSGERVDVRQRLTSAGSRRQSGSLPLRKCSGGGVSGAAGGGAGGAGGAETGSLERARAALERRKQTLAAANEEMSGAACRVETTRVNPDSLIDELLAATDLGRAVSDSAENSGLQLYIGRDGTAELGSRPRRPAAVRVRLQPNTLHR